MATNEKKHPICEKHPFLACLVLMIIGLFAPSVGGLFPASDTVQYLVGIVLCIFILIIYGLWFAPQFNGVAKLMVPMNVVLLFIGIFCIYVLAGEIVTILFLGISFNISISAVIMALTAGVCEETSFRAMSIPIGMRYFKSKNKVMTTVILMSLIFGVVHMGNALNGADIGMSIIQVVNSFFMGVFLSALYLRTGSIVPSMFAHLLIDFVSFAFDPMVNKEGLLTEALTGKYLTDSVIQVCITVILGIIGFYMLRKAQQDEIDRIWNEKWSVRA